METAPLKMDIGIFEHDLQNGKTRYSRPLLSMLGYAGEEAPSLNEALRLLVHPADRRRMEKLWNDIVAGQRDELYENLRLKIRKGDYIRISAALMKTGGQRITGVIINREPLFRVHASVQELEGANKNLEKFVYHSSHDLKSPLKSILGLVGLLKQEKDPEAVLVCIEMVESAVLRLEKLVNDLLSLSRNKEVDDPLQRIYLMAEVNQAVSQVAHAADLKNLEIVPMIHEPVPFIGDLTRTRIVLNNLISNALKYRSFDRERSLIGIEARVDERNVVINIADNGLGIPASKTDKVFDMFYRASDASEGSGLGLYIVKSAVEKMKGSITLKSEEGEGTVFTVTVPNHWRETTRG